MSDLSPLDTPLSDWINQSDLPLASTEPSPARGVSPRLRIDLPDPTVGPLLKTQAVYKSYRKSSLEIPVLKGIDLEVRLGEFMAIVGQSGCGKSTLLHLLGTLDAPDQGEIYFESNRIDNLPTAGRELLRNKYFGMIFQFYLLLSIAGARANCWIWWDLPTVKSINPGNSPVVKCNAPQLPER